ncbi:MAG: alpha-1,4-glucan--maltose-1-phosphate maltosyltransferase [Actinomycetota bacterium]|nr:alpha-1,4-glucan--maltose-1-phosphate maltosyltransferase [Actinomycetota bacterium]
MKSFLRRGHVIVENVQPQVDCGRYRAKTITGDDVEVGADIYRDGPALLAATIRYRGPGDKKWSEARMTHVDNDRWAGTFRPDRIGAWEFVIEAWTDRFATWRRDLIKRVEAAQDVDLELEEGARMLEDHLRAFPSSDRPAVKEAIVSMRLPGEPASSLEDTRVQAAIDEHIAELMAAHHTRGGATVTKPALQLTVDRELARFGAWYEFFPRSTGRSGAHGTFKTATEELGRIADMGFDIVYLPPIHPIGRAYRKGRNNTLTPTATDVGVPWAIGGSHGGHTAVHPELGTLADFREFTTSARRHGLEVALDFAIQCSPDHPWVTQNPEWFVHRPDGSIRYAENPPKKYQDIYPVDFDTSDREGLWSELKGVLDFWIDQGVVIFRVDNPHTKAFPFWEWCIGEIKAEHPEVILLSEAFTRPKVMMGLAKLGFTQSYTYFTWRNSKAELTEYLTELTTTDMARYFMPNFFANTPDILHEYLQTGGRPAFKIRLVLASLLSPSYGIYSGYELCENTPVHPGSEEYLNSEKYELRPRDYDAEGNLSRYITRINRIRKAYPALSRLTNLTFHHVDKENLIAFSKSVEGETPILAIVNLNPFHWEEGMLTMDLGALGLSPWDTFKVHDLITDETFEWQGRQAYVRLDPFHEPAHVLRVLR